MRCDVREGRVMSQFSESCDTCHGRTYVGETLPALAPSELNKETLESLPEDNMAALAGFISPCATPTAEPSGAPLPPSSSALAVQ